MDLASIFAGKQTNEIEWGGPLFSLYELPTGIGELDIRFVAAIPEPCQGLRLKIGGGTFKTQTTAIDDLVLWRDTAPSEVRIMINWGSTQRRVLRLWNAWRVNGVTHAWLGNSGMRVIVGEAGGALTFRCSDGVGEPDFEDLVVEVHVR